MSIDIQKIKLMAEHATGFTDMSLAPDVVLALIAENERLERKNANQSESIREYQDLVMGGDVSLGMLKADLRVTTGERDELKAECEGLRKDADRYRWLRNTNIPLDGHDFLSTQEILDYRIDAFMRKEAEN